MPSPSSQTSPGSAPNRARRRRILLIDDHPAIRDLLAALIDSQSDLEVCGQAEDAAEALQLFKTLRPDAAILDLYLKNSCGFDLLRELPKVCPGVPVLVFSGYDDASYAERALRAGAMGFVNKQEPSPNVLSALRTVLSGGVHVREDVIGNVLRRVSSRGRSAGGNNVGSERALTDRELEVYSLIGQGRSVREIADYLNVTPKTVQAHRENIRHKLDVKSSNDVLRRAIEYTRERAHT